MAHRLPKHGYDELAGLQLFTPSTPSKCYSSQNSIINSSYNYLIRSLFVKYCFNRQRCNTQQKLYFSILLKKSWWACWHQGIRSASPLSSNLFMLQFYQAIDQKAYFHLRILRAKRWWQLPDLSWILNFELIIMYSTTPIFATTNVQCVRSGKLSSAEQGT